MQICKAGHLSLSDPPLPNPRQEPVLRMKYCKALVAVKLKLKLSHCARCDKIHNNHHNCCPAKSNIGVTKFVINVVKLQRPVC
jgi:hypothetical protein